MDRKKQVPGQGGGDVAPASRSSLRTRIMRRMKSWCSYGERDCWDTVPRALLPASAASPPPPRPYTRDLLAWKLDFENARGDSAARSDGKGAPPRLFVGRQKTSIRPHEGCNAGACGSSGGSAGIIGGGGSAGNAGTRGSAGSGGGRRRRNPYAVEMRRSKSAGHSQAPGAARQQTQANPALERRAQSDSALPRVLPDNGLPLARVLRTLSEAREPLRRSISAPELTTPDSNPVRDGPAEPPAQDPTASRRHSSLPDLRNE